MDILESDFDTRNMNATVLDPNGSPLYMDFEMNQSGGRGLFTTDDYGMHEVKVEADGEAVRGAPHFVRSMPRSKRDYDGI